MIVYCHIMFMDVVMHSSEASVVFLNGRKQMQIFYCLFITVLS